MHSLPLSAALVAALFVAAPTAAASSGNWRDSVPCLTPDCYVSDGLKLAAWHSRNHATKVGRKSRKHKHHHHHHTGQRVQSVKGDNPCHEGASAPKGTKKTAAVQPKAQAAAAEPAVVRKAAFKIGSGNGNSNKYKSGNTTVSSSSGSSSSKSSAGSGVSISIGNNSTGSTSNTGNSTSQGSVVDNGSSKTAKLTALDGPIRNPLMGFRGGSGPWTTHARWPIPWSDLENSASDGLDKFQQFADKNWAASAAKNEKIVPRVYLEWTSGDNHWPADMTAGDYSSDQFKQRLAAFIAKMGQAWDTNPQIAWIETGIYGGWGEQSGIPDDLQTYMGNLFVKAFPNKRLLVRYTGEFTKVNYDWGIYPDSYFNAAQDNGVNGEIIKFGSGFKNVVDGEVAYDWGTMPGSSPDETLSSSKWLDYAIGKVRDGHVTGLGWIAEYTASNSAIAAGAAKLQAAFGYRFTVDSVTFPATISSGQAFGVSLNVINTGSAPFYYNWPLNLVLLDSSSLKPVWTAPFTGVDIRKWLPGNTWSGNAYQQAPSTNKASGAFTIAKGSVDSGSYILALSINDPAGGQPSIRLAVQNYIQGGYHPFGSASVDSSGAASISLSDSKMTDTTGLDSSLSYKA